MSYRANNPKSWPAPYLCLYVAKVEPVWELPGTKGDTLYLCLEDSCSRIPSRLLDINDSALNNLFFSAMSEKLRSGLEEHIGNLLHDNAACHSTCS